MGREKGKSPFHPGQPVPPELFVGRKPQIDRILERGAGQVAAGKSVCMFVEGEYGIGKSSIAGFAQRVAEEQFGLLPVSVNLGGVGDLEGLSARLLEAVVMAAKGPTAIDRIREWLGKYVGRQTLFGLTVNLEALKRYPPRLESPSQMLGFLRETLERLGPPMTGMFLCLDELNGIVNDPRFPHFIKGLVEENAASSRPLPLLLMLCGVEDRRRTMIRHHPAVDRLFYVVEIEKMSQEEMEEFFTRSFADAGMTVTRGAMHVLTQYSAGLPKVMHVIGEEAYFQSGDVEVREPEAYTAVVAAAEEIGRKFVDQQVIRALKSPDYHSILDKLGRLGASTAGFTKKEIAEGLTPGEKKKLDNFLTRMKKLHVLRSGDSAGEYVFNVQMVRVYIWLRTQHEKAARPR